MRDICGPRRPFMESDISNKELILTMLRHEDSLMLGPAGAAIFADKTLPHLTDLDTYFIFHRAALSAHGFTTTGEDVANYRKIFSHYYAGPQAFDADVLGAVCYMRQNKCVYYTAPLIHLGDDAPNTDLLTLNGARTSLFEMLDTQKHAYTFVGAFSNS